MSSDTIAGIASGMGGGIGIIRVSGEDALTAVGKIFRTPRFAKNSDKKNNSKEWNEKYLVLQNTHTIHYGYIVEKDGNILDEVMVLLMKAPKSYTCEDVVEIDAHGGPYIVQKILHLLLQEIRTAEKQRCSIS